MGLEKLEYYRSLFSKYGIQLTETQYQKLANYAEMLINEKQNLSAVRDAEAVWVRHFLDSSYLSQHLDVDSKVLDMGTGGGIPAIPLAILRPDLQISMLDSEQNKIDFCTRVIAALSLNANAICARAEELAHDNQFRNTFDFVVSRAMASGSMLCELSVSFLKIGGKLIAMKGRSFDPNSERFHSAAITLHCAEPNYLGYKLENEDKVLVFVQKSAETDLKYPRRFAKIKRNPL